MVAPKVKQIVARILRVQSVDIDDRLDDLGADSLDKAELMMELSDEFNVANITDAEADRVKTVKQIVELLERKGVR